MELPNDLNGWLAALWSLAPWLLLAAVHVRLDAAVLRAAGSGRAHLPLRRARLAGVQPGEPAGAQHGRQQHRAGPDAAAGALRGVRRPDRVGAAGLVQEEDAAPGRAQPGL